MLAPVGPSFWEGQRAYRLYVRMWSCLLAEGSGGKHNTGLTINKGKNRYASTLCAQPRRLFLRTGGSPGTISVLRSPELLFLALLKLREAFTLLSSITLIQHVNVILFQQTLLQ